jgi:hypothetical protein
MPTSGTHITIVQRLALDPVLQPFLGNPDAQPGSPAEKQMRFANLGAVGPDIFYAMADYRPEVQDLEDFLVKVGGTFEAILDVMGQIQRYIDGVVNEITLGIVEGLENTVALISGTVKNFILGLLVDNGYNFWPFFEAARQRDLPRSQWFWADYLHYVRSGRFVRKLLELSGQDPNLRAYALGYLTHYVTDVVGHPYVNQVVQAPWRLYWQRHHLVENFIDAYVWDRWHVPSPAPAPPNAAEQPPDRVTKAANAQGTGAPFNFARLNDLISIGIPTLGDPIDGILNGLADGIANGLADLGVSGFTEPPAPNDPDFVAWTRMMERALKEVYQDDPLHPQRLMGVGRPNGFPTADDIAAAYGVMRFFLKLSTEDKIQDSKAPNIVDDISQAVQDLVNQIENDIGGLRAPPLPSTHGHFSLSALWDAVKNLAEWAADTVAKVVKTAFDFAKGLVNVALTPVKDVVKFTFFLINKALFALYRHVRETLVLAAYNIPYTEELATSMGALFSTADLWQTKGNLGAGRYPVEEILEEEEFTGNGYSPIVPPNQQPTPDVELNSVRLTAPYPAGLPDVFIDTPRGPDDLFSVNGHNGPLQFNDDSGRNFGGALENCQRGILLATGKLAGEFQLPNYNLDGDRGYAWPCWQVKPEPDMNHVPDPLNPRRLQAGQHVTVNPVLLDGLV